MQAPHPPNIECFDQVQAIIVAAADRSAARDLVRRTLGARLLASPDLLDVLRIYLRLQSNTSRTADETGTHRNTVQTRVDKALRLLPER
ncbi:transcriptional regulator, partial [Mycobacterium sp. ITM-2017-0098]